MESILLQVNNISKYYISPTGEQTPYILREINLQVGAGESVAIIGPSGSGKSTLLNLIGTLDSASEGQVLLEGQDFSQFDDKKLAAIRNRHIGFVFQMHHLLPQCTVLENVLIPTLAESSKADKEIVLLKAKQLLERVGLSHRLDYRPGLLSGGECQRVAVVRALINSPKLLLADEPTGSLDQAASENLAHLLVDLNREQEVALVVVTHSRKLAFEMDKVYRLIDGTLEAEERV